MADEKSNSALELSVPEDREALTAWFEVGRSIADHLSGSDVSPTFRHIFRKIMERFDRQLRDAEPAFEMRILDGRSSFGLQGGDDEKRLLEGFETWDIVTEQVLNDFECETWDAIRRAVDQYMIRYNNSTIYRQTMEFLDKKLKDQLQTARVHVEHSLKCVHSTPSCFSSTWDKRLKERINTLESELMEERRKADPRPSKRSRKQTSTSGNGVVGQTSVQDDFWANEVKSAAKASIYYEYGLDAHVGNVEKTLFICVIKPLADENIGELYGRVTKSTIENSK